MQGYKIALGLLIIPGMVLIVKSTDVSMQMGIIVGLASAVFATLFSTFNKKLIGRADDMNITFLEIGSAWLFLTLVLPFVYYGQFEELLFWPSWLDWFYLLILAFLCTTLAYVLALKALHHLSAFAANLTINLEPVYGVILAWLLLDDASELSGGFYLGSFIIIASVFSYPMLKRRFEKD